MLSKQAPSPCSTHKYSIHSLLISIFFCLHFTFRFHTTYKHAQFTIFVLQCIIITIIIIQFYIYRTSLSKLLVLCMVQKCTYVPCSHFMYGIDLIVRFLQSTFCSKSLLQFHFMFIFEVYSQLTSVGIEAQPSPRRENIYHKEIFR